MSVYSLALRLVALLVVSVNSGAVMATGNFFFFLPPTS